MQSLIEAIILKDIQNRFKIRNVNALRKIAHHIINFVVYDKGTAVELIQVAYEIDAVKTYNREISSLVNASNHLRCDNLTLITFSATRDAAVDGKTIHIRSAIEWLLSEEKHLVSRIS